MLPQVCKRNLGPKKLDNVLKLNYYPRNNKKFFIKNAVAGVPLPLGVRQLGLRRDQSNVATREFCSSVFCSFKLILQVHNAMTLPVVLVYRVFGQT